MVQIKGGENGPLSYILKGWKGHITDGPIYRWGKWLVWLSISVNILTVQFYHLPLFWNLHQNQHVFFFKKSIITDGPKQRGGKWTVKLYFERVKWSTVNGWWSISVNSLTVHFYSLTVLWLILYMCNHKSSLLNQRTINHEINNIYWLQMYLLKWKLTEV